jgi:hypothetical protein
MDRVWLGCLLGADAGALSVALMLPMQFPDRRAAFLGAFCNRFAIGFAVGISALRLSPLVAGALIGFVLSLADAIITRAVVPILVMGTLFGALIGWGVAAWGVG